MRMARREHGFTLIEAVISVAILGFIGTLVFGTFSRAMDARQRAEEITDHYHQVRQAMLRMSREISMAFLSTQRDCQDPRTRTIFVGHNASNGMRLDFTSFSHFKMVADANESDQNELSYFIDDDPDNHGKMALLRREQNRIDEEPDEGGVTQLLAENVTHLEFEFYDPTTDRWVDNWDSSNSDFKNRLPMFVSIKMKVSGKNGKEEEFQTKTRVFLRQAIKILGTGFAGCID